MLSDPSRKKSAFSLELILATLFSCNAYAQQTPAEKLERARLEYSYKNFQNAVDLLTGLLHPTVQLSTEDDIVSAREMLGLCYFYLGKEAEARQEFIALLYLRPSHRLDPFLIPPPAVEFFDDIRNEPELSKKLKEILKAQKPPDENTKEKIKFVYRERDIEVRNRFVSFLPFGLGQFQNGDRLKGVLFATGQGLALTSNIVCYGLLLNLANENGRYAPGDISLARGLRVGQYVSLGLFLAAWIASAVEANLNFTPAIPSAWRSRQTDDNVDDVGRVPDAFSLSWGWRW